VFPIAVAVLIVLGTAIGLWLMPIGILYQDVEQILLIGLPLWMVCHADHLLGYGAVQLAWVNQAAGY
jgi:hypothetical protein